MRIIHISIHAPTRGATMCRTCVGPLFYFNPRSHERSDQRGCLYVVTPVYFNPRSHERSDQPPQPLPQEYTDFNPRSHERSDMLGRIRVVISSLFQSTLPREERHVSAFTKSAGINFNPRSHERSDLSSKSKPNSSAYFNPRSHERSDCICAVCCCIFCISIHAPTRGATELDIVPFNK